MASFFFKKECKTEIRKAIKCVPECVFRGWTNKPSVRMILKDQLFSHLVEVDVSGRNANRDVVADVRNFINGWLCSKGYRF